MLRKHDVLLVGDEVICGFWRTGNYWGSETCGMHPDIITCAKALSASFQPISAVIVNERVFEPLARQSHVIGTLWPRIHLFRPSVAAAVAIGR